MLTKNYQRQIGLSIFRVIISFLIARNLIHYLPYAEEFFGNSSVYPISGYIESLSNARISFFKYPFNSVFSPTLFLWIGISLSLLLLFGIFKQLSSIALFIYILILLLRNPFITEGSDNVIQVTLPFLAFADSYRYFSYNPFKIRIKNPIVKEISLQVKKYALIGFLIQVCIIYLFSGIPKLRSDLWYNGTATYYALRVDKYLASPLNIYLTKNAFFVIFSTYSVMLFELSFPFLIWFKKTKWYLIGFGTVFHLGIWFLMKIDVFPWIMIATYFVFITDDEYTSIYNRIQSIKLKILKRTF